MKERIKSYSFWVGLAGAVVAVVQAIGKAVGFIPNEEIISNIILGIAGVLVALGIVSKPKNINDQNNLQEKEETMKEKIEENIIED